MRRQAWGAFAWSVRHRSQSSELRPADALLDVGRRPSLHLRSTIHQVILAGVSPFRLRTPASTAPTVRNFGVAFIATFRCGTWFAFYTPRSAPGFRCAGRAIFACAGNDCERSAAVGPPPEKEFLSLRHRR